MSSKKYMKEYRRKNKEHIKEVSQKRYLKNRERIIEKAKKWAIENNEKARAKYSKRYYKDRELILLRKKTQYYFPLKGHNCEFCVAKATQHHHNTQPIEFDKFNYICMECHREIHGTLLVRTTGSKISL